MKQQTESSHTTSITLSGLEVAALHKKELLQRAARLQQHGVYPKLGILLVGDDPASRTYTRGKQRDCAEVGIEADLINLPATASEDQIAAAITALNQRADITAFIVQLPLPDGINEQRMLECIDPSKDADGLHPTNLGRLVLGLDPTEAIDAPLPCTPLGIVELLTHYHIDLPGKRAVVIGRGITVGRPLSLLLSRRGIDTTVIQVHSKTPDIADEIQRADIVIAALGSPHFVQPEWIKPGAAVLDVGVTRTGTTTSTKTILTGDVHPEVSHIAGWLSPNPHGVGPMTRVMLVTNVIATAERQLALIS